MNEIILLSAGIIIGIMATSAVCAYLLHRTHKRKYRMQNSIKDVKVDTWPSVPDPGEGNVYGRVYAVSGDEISVTSNIEDERPVWKTIKVVPEGETISTSYTLKTSEWTYVGRPVGDEIVWELFEATCE